MSEEREVSVNVTFRNTDSSDALRSYATEKISNCVRKFVHQNSEAHMVLKVEKNRQIAEVTFHSDGHDFACKEESDDLYKSVDRLVDSLSHQLRKHKERLTSHHKH